MRPKIRYFLFRMFSLPKQAWNIFCGDSAQPYAKWHRPTNYLLFVRVYAVIILLFALLFSLTGNWKISNEDKKLGDFDAVYFSVVTVTTLGYGDVVPRSPIQKFLVASEVILGIVVFGAMLVWLGQSMSKHQHDAFQVSEQKRRERPLTYTYYSIAQALTEFLKNFDAKHPKYSTYTDFEIYYYGSNSVFTKPTYFTPVDFVDTTKSLRRVKERIDRDFWINDLDICIKLVSNSASNAPTPIDDEELLQLLGKFHIETDRTRSRIFDLAPIKSDERKLRTYCEEFETSINAASSLRDAIFTKANSRADYSSIKYVGGIIEAERQRELRKQRDLAPFMFGKKLGEIWRSVKRLIKVIVAKQT